MNPGAERRGMVLFVGCECHHGGAQDKVSRMEERGDTEPGVLQNGIQNTPVGDGNTQRRKQLRGEIQKRHMRSKAPNTPCILEGIEAIREIQGQQGESGAQRCLWHPGWGTGPRGIEPRVQREGWDRLSRRNLPFGASNWLQHTV